MLWLADNSLQFVRWVLMISNAGKKKQFGELDRSFPFAVISLNLTLAVLQACRARHLNALCNEYGSVGDVVCQVYAGAMLIWTRTWKTQGCGVMDSSKMLKFIKMEIEKRPAALVEAWRQRVPSEGGVVSGQLVPVSGRTPANDVEMSELR